MGPLSLSRGSPWGRPWILLSLSALVAALLALVLTTGQSIPQAVRDLHGRSTDLVWRLTADKAPERRIVLVDIDERSLSEVGTWPWPRQTQARLMDRLQASGSALQIWDFTFAGEGVGSPAERQQGVQQLGQALARHGAVFGQIFALPGSASDRPADVAEGTPAGALAWDRCGAPFPQATGHLASPESLLSGLKAPSVGHITPRLEGDGILRRQPAVICRDGLAYPALSMAALDQAAGRPGWELVRGGWFEPPWRLVQSGARGGLSIPLDARGDITIAWHQHPEGYVSISAADVLAGRVPSGLLDGAWVLVGGSAFGLNDRVATPFSPQSPGMVAHAQILLNALDERTPRRARAEPALQALAAGLGMALLAGVFLWATRRAQGGGLSPSGFSLAGLPLLALLAVPVLWLLHALLLRVFHLWVGWAVPAAAVMAFGFSLGLLAHARSRIDRDRLYRHLSSYLPSPVAQTLAGQDPSSRIEASQRPVTVLFADIRNFSAFCEARPPEEAAGVLHAFFMRAHAIVRAHGGEVEALQGDSLVATWNAFDSRPGDVSQGAEQALAAARQLLAAADEFLPPAALPGLEPLALGVGLETGPAMTGSIGPAERRTHAVLGRTVTIASRLVGMTAELAHPLLVGEGLAAQLGGHHDGQRLQSLGVFLLEGLRVPHHIYAWPLAPQGGTLAGARSPAASTVAPSAARPAPAMTPVPEQPPPPLH